MKKTILAAILACASPLLAFADDAPARPDIDELFTVMRVEQNMQVAFDQVKQMLPKMTAEAAQSSNTPTDTAKVDKAQQKALEVVEKEFSWAALKPEFTRIYAETFTPEEIKGITAFYKSPAGQSFVNKQPELMKKTMTLMQSKMMQLTPKLQAAIQSEIQADKKAK